MIQTTASHMNEGLLKSGWIGPGMFIHSICASTNRLPCHLFDRVPSSRDLAYVALLDNHIESCFRSTGRAIDAPLFGRLHPHTMQPLPGPLVLFPNHSLRVAIQAQLHNATDTQGAAAPANETRTPPGPPSQ